MSRGTEAAHLMMNSQPVGPECVDFPSNFLCYRRGDVFSYADFFNPLLHQIVQFG